MRTKLIKSTYFELYKKKQPITISKHLQKLKKLSFDKNSFGYSVSGSAVFSSMIEGNPIDFDTFLRYTESGMSRTSKSFKEINDLIKAYEFAEKSELILSNFLKSHKILSKNFEIDTKYKGTIRDKAVYIYAGRVKVYTGAAPEIVKSEMKTLFEDISILKQRELSIAEIFYFASMIHLIFVKIHPFADGNGRTARLLEKWFLAEKLGQSAWFIQSEKLYQKRLKSYYRNVDLGETYETINYNLCIPFLLMLPMSLTAKL